MGWLNITVHFSTAIFFGWMLGKGVIFFYETPSADQIAVAGALGAYLGDKVVDFMYSFAKIDRRKSDS